jgi:uncharacterized repeat protein (TIGR01451 family)
VTQGDLDAGSVYNAAHATGSPPSGPAVDSPPSAVTVEATQGPALTLVKTTTTADYAAVGDPIDYGFAVTNSGNVTLSGVTVVDGLSGLGAISCGATAYPIASLAAGATVHCTATYHVTQGDLDAGSVYNAAHATGSPPSGPPVDSTPSAVTVEAGVAALHIAKTVNAASAVPGSTLTYTVTVTNTGSLPFGIGGHPDAEFKDSLIGIAADATYVAGSVHATAGSAAYGPSSGITWTGPLDVGGAASVTFQVRVHDPDRGRHLLANVVVSTSSGSNCASGSKDPECSTRTPVASMALAKQVCGSIAQADCTRGGAGPWTSAVSVAYGAPAYWRIQVTNTGRVALHGVRLSDLRVPACAEVAGAFSLPVGGELTIYCSSADVTAAFTNVVGARAPAPSGTPPGSPAIVPPDARASVDVAQVGGSGAVGPKGPGVTG